MFKKNFKNLKIKYNKNQIKDKYWYSNQNLNCNIINVAIKSNRQHNESSKNTLDYITDRILQIIDESDCTKIPNKHEAKT